MADKYWTVKMEVYAFETFADAKAYQEAFIDAFCAMPESEGYGSGCTIIEEDGGETIAPSRETPHD